MGANAQIAVPAFTAGQILTAAQQTQINTGIPVFATTTTRDAAFGGAGEKALAQGQTCYIEATSSYQTYNGSSWVALVTAPGLVLVTTATATAVQTLSINDCFSSTYAAYEIEIINTTSVGANARYTARLRLSGTDTTTGYRDQRLYAYSTFTGADANTTGTDEWYVGDLDPTVKAYFTKMTLHNPNVATPTTMAIRSNNVTSAGDLHLQVIGGVQTDSTQFTGITFITAGTSFTGTIRVYGYANS